MAGKKRIIEFQGSIEDALTKSIGSTSGEKKRIVFSPEDAASIVDSHINNHEPPCIISCRYNCSPPVIYRLLVQQGVYEPIGSRKYFFNENYFAKIDTPRKAYWLGLFYADACVAKNYTFSLGLKREDRYILEKLAVDVGHNGNIYDYEQIKSIEGGPVKAYPASTIALCSKKFCYNLSDKGVIVGKTFRLKFPDLTDNLRRHFIRGLFDGDGFISVTTGKSGVNKGRTFMSWGITGQGELLDAVNKIVAMEVGIKPAVVHKKTNENCWVVQYATSIGNNVRRFDSSRVDDLLKIKDWLYKDACIFFNRKKIKFDTVKISPSKSGLSIKESAEYIGMNSDVLCTHATKGHIPSYKEGMYRLFKIEDVEKFKSLWMSSDTLPWDKRLENIGENNQAAKLSEQKVREIRQAFKEGFTYNELADEHDVTNVSIRNVVTYKTWKHVA